MKKLKKLREIIADFFVWNRDQKFCSRNRSVSEFGLVEPKKNFLDKRSSQFLSCFREKASKIRWCSSTVLTFHFSSWVTKIEGTQITRKVIATQKVGFVRINSEKLKKSNERLPKKFQLVSKCITMFSGITQSSTTRLNLTRSLWTYCAKGETRLNLAWPNFSKRDLYIQITQLLSFPLEKKGQSFSIEWEKVRINWPNSLSFIYCLTTLLIPHDRETPETENSRCCKKWKNNI